MDHATILLTPDQGVDFAPRASDQAELIAVALNYSIQIKLGTEVVGLKVLLIDSRNDAKYTYWFVKGK